MAVIYYSKGMKKKLAKGKHVRQSPKETRYKHQNPLSGESYQMGLIPPATSYDNMYEVPSARKLIRDLVLKVFINELVTQVFSALHEPKFQNPRRRNEHHKLKRENPKPHCFYDGEHENTLQKHFWCSHPSFHLGNNRDAPEIQAPHCQTSANLATVLSKDRSLRSAMLSFLLSS